MHTLRSQPRLAHLRRPPSGARLGAAAWALSLALLLTGPLAPAQAAPPQRPGSSDAHSLPDPTRPPLAMQLATTASHLARQVARPDDAASAPRAAAEASLPVLQGVQVPARGPATAMLDGRLVKVGDSVGNRVVSDIDSQGITLRGALGSHRLSLLGGSRKQAAGSILISRSAGYSATEPGDAATGRQGPDLAPPPPDRPPDRPPERQPERQPSIRGSHSGAGVNRGQQNSEPGPAAGGITMSQRRTAHPPATPLDATTPAPPAPHNEPALKDAGNRAGVAPSATTTPATTGATSAAGASNHSPAAPPDKPVVLASKPRP